MSRRHPPSPPFKNLLHPDHVLRYKPFTKPFALSYHAQLIPLGVVLAEI